MSLTTRLAERKQKMTKIMNDIGRKLREKNDDSYRYFKLLSFDCPVVPEIIYNMVMLNAPVNLPLSQLDEHLMRDLTNNEGLLSAVALAVREYRNAVHPTQLMKRNEIERLAVFTDTLIEKSNIADMTKQEVYQKVTTERVKRILQRDGYETTILANSSTHHDSDSCSFIANPR